MECPGTVTDTKTQCKSFWVALLRFTLLCFALLCFALLWRWVVGLTGNVVQRPLAVGVGVVVVVILVVVVVIVVVVVVAATTVVVVVVVIVGSFFKRYNFLG
ncbi:hypothetical protein HZH68_017030 [Vespula germanica]|uniref:Uncharacterized protein n=1 Tax=Vespula germanica TaxID=30212 RepID=A0A834MN29_VESGE|nr:hypothetical protein HZH68_017030 [Vespula germanica]